MVERKILQPIAVITTTSSREEARLLAGQLVEQGLAACVQISEIESVYRWNGTVQQEAEFRLLIKTEQPLYDAVEQAILNLHSYELPAIFSLALDRIEPAYGIWLQDNLTLHP